MISTTSSSVSYTGNASTVTAYPIPFPFLAASHVAAFKTSSAGVVTPLAIGTDYSVSGNLDSNGRITSGDLRTVVALAGTETLTIRRVTPATQTMDLVDGGQLSAETLEGALDKMIMVAQESVRDALGGGETNVEVSGTGIVVQTAPATFSSRVIGVAAASGLSITNGDGVAGNPVIDLDGAVLDAVTTTEATDTVRVETAAGSRKIPVPNLIARTTSRQIQLPISAASVGGGSSGITLNPQYLNFTNTATGSALIRFYLPSDFVSSGTVKVKLRSYLFGGINTDQYRLSVAAYAENTLTTAIVSSVVAQNLYHNSADTRTPVFSLTGLEGGSFYSLFISRVTADAWDTASSAARVTDFVIEYPSQDAPAGW
jgi:hypothetical protein